MKNLVAGGILFVVLCVLQAPVDGLYCYSCVLNCNTVYNNTVPGERVLCNQGDQCDVTYLLDAPQTRGCSSSCVSSFTNLLIVGRAGTHCCSTDDCNGDVSGPADTAKISLLTMSAACLMGWMAARGTW